MSVRRASGKITNISHVCEVELSPRISSITRTFNSGFPLVREIHEVPLDFSPSVCFSPLRMVLSVCFLARAVRCYALPRGQRCFGQWTVVHASRIRAISSIETGQEPMGDHQRCGNETRTLCLVPKCPAAAGRGKHQQEKRPQGGLGWVGGGMGEGPCGLMRTVGPRGRCMAWGRVRGWRRLVHPRVLTAWEGRLCAA